MTINPLEVHLSWPQSHIILLVDNPFLGIHDSRTDADDDLVTVGLLSISFILGTIKTLRILKNTTHKVLFLGELPFFSL